MNITAILSHCHQKRRILQESKWLFDDDYDGYDFSTWREKEINCNS